MGDVRAEMSSLGRSFQMFSRSISGQPLLRIEKTSDLQARLEINGLLSIPRTRLQKRAARQTRQSNRVITLLLRSTVLQEAKEEYRAEGLSTASLAQEPPYSNRQDTLLAEIHPILVARQTGREIAAFELAIAAAHLSHRSLPLLAAKFNDSAGDPPVITMASMDQSELCFPTRSLASTGWPRCPCGEKAPAGEPTFSTSRSCDPLLSPRLYCPLPAVSVFSSSFP